MLVGVQRPRYDPTVSSRLERAKSGRAVRVVVTAPDVGLQVGDVFYVLGDELPCAEPGFAFTGTRTGRANTVTAPKKRSHDWVPVDV
jgi:hypothetical protein